MHPLLYAAVVLAPFAAWALLPDRDAKGKPVTGVYPISVDSHGRPTSPSLVGDTRGAR